MGLQHAPLDGGGGGGRGSTIRSVAKRRDSLINSFC